MAKPIRATPVLRGKEADEFIRKMIEFEKSPISAVDKKIASRIKKNKKSLSALFSLNL
ncbi:MAG TPA: hypothetical protein VJK05_04450 [archaeon]|nr:hypothetical protein [archaeon]